MRKLLKKQGFAPKLLITDKLGSYGSAFRQLRLTCPHHRGNPNNRAQRDRRESIRNAHMDEAVAAADSRGGELRETLALLRRARLRNQEQWRPMWRPRNAGVQGGTMSSNPLSSSSQSVSAVNPGAAPEKARTLAAFCGWLGT